MDHLDDKIFSTFVSKKTHYKGEVIEIGINLYGFSQRNVIGYFFPSDHGLSFLPNPEFGFFDIFNTIWFTFSTEY